MYEHLDRRYARALYEISEKKGKTQEYLKQAKEIVELIKSNEELYNVIKHPEINSFKKKNIIKGIFKGKIEDDLLSFMILLIEKDRILYMEEKINEMEKMHLKKQNIIVAHVKTVIPLDDNQRTKLIEKLKYKYSNKKILLKEEIDKELIGGAYIRIGDDVMDGTIKNKFKEIERNSLSK
ncbi:F0F1 ATP synthase subunit delta [Clostridium aestuarii]|uniref:ATP synthase subunit delta n=1 Tax=Clostridium aestuarii TaxID=338193 RepID=A0ABT4D310_9CLOT|nr:F0F1 ATP synthase subunit delta [Clostridium aestuarii]MCY6485625.1 F0F1 ATP synthase subunit delta [Clostridium aestuarii]